MKRMPREMMDLGDQMGTTQRVAVERTVLGKLQVAIGSMISEEPVLRGAEVDGYYEHLARAWAVKLRRYVLTLGEQTVRYPADWREAVKARWAPAWFLKRHPVVYEERKVFAAVCPHSFADAPGKHLEFFTMPKMPRAGMAARWPEEF